VASHTTGREVARHAVPRHVAGHALSPERRGPSTTGRVVVCVALAARYALQGADIA